MTKEEFIIEIKKIRIDINEHQLEQLEKFYDILIKKNEVINLTCITEKKEVYLKHFYDSLTLAMVEDFNKNIKICDVGSGAGFPGIVLKILFPKIDIILIDSLRKRINYLNELISILDLKNIKAIHTRMEDFSKKNEEYFDIVIARAVSSIKILSEISVKSLKISGKLLLMKGLFKEELNDSYSAFNKLNLQIQEIKQFQLPIEGSNRSIIVLKKISKTVDIYPRNIDKIKKNPL